MKWIRVQDRLPECGSNVFVYTCKYMGACKTKHTSRLVCSYDVNKFNVAAFRFCGAVLLDVTHWMPLPEPPEDEE